MKSIEILVYSLSSPLKIGIYENSELIEEFTSIEKTSEILPLYMEDILKRYNIKALFYVKGPGSFMSIKITYIFLKTFSIINNVQLKATLGFNVNNNRPISAMRGLYFVNEEGEINIKRLNNIDEKTDLPKILDYNLFEENSLPYYKLPVA